MLDGHHQHVPVVGEPDEPQPQRAVLGEVEGRPAVLAGERGERRLPAGLVVPAEVGLGPLRRQPVEHHLVRGAVRRRPVDGAQHLLPLRDPHEAAAQRLAVQRAGDPQHDADVERGPGRVDLVDEPHPLLRVRQRDPHAGRPGGYPLPGGGRGEAALFEQTLPQGAPSLGWGFGLCGSGLAHREFLYEVSAAGARRSPGRAARLMEGRSPGPRGPGPAGQGRAFSILGRIWSVAHSTFSTPGEISANASEELTVM